ncbi:hypothetical protein F5Y08DRAFT_337469 [Xylaria arbuscula]|nr:hypothetical protein F5Y08DRAFT_337469 [Xylaria arbuscula]
MDSNVGNHRRGNRELTGSHRDNPSGLSANSISLSGGNSHALDSRKSLEIVGDLEHVQQAIKALEQAGVEPGQIITVKVTFGPPPVSPRPKGIKRSASEDDGATADAPTRKRPKREQLRSKVSAPIVCGNCGGKNHKAAFCIKIGKSGWVECCPKCDGTEHMYEVCPQRLNLPKDQRPEEDFKYLVFNRQNKPPIKSTLKLGNLILNERVRLSLSRIRDYPISLPYSSRFARQEARQNDSSAYTYAYVGNPSLEAKHRIAQRTRASITLEDALKDTAVVQQVWSTAEETFDPKLDAPMPVLRPIREKALSSTQSTRHAPTPTILPKREKRESPKPTPSDIPSCSSCGLGLDRCGCP